VRVHFQAFGCTLNKGESFRMAEMAREAGFLLTESPEEAECTVVSTCTVIETTERKMLRRLSELAASGKPIVVSGCMAEIQRNLVMSAAPQALLLPIDEIERIGEVLRDISAERVDSRGAMASEQKRIDVAVPIAQGCAGSCTYCITRLARGKMRSRSIEDIQEDVARAVGNGYREIRVCAQDTAAFGRDLGSSLSELIEKLAGLPGEYRIRIGMMNPSTLVDIKEGVLEAYGLEKVYKFLHLPLQSGSDRILELMGRGYASEDWEQLVEEFRRRHDDIALSTDIIVGFPGETDEDFEDSYDLIRRIQPDLLNITRFSAREGTPASELNDRVVGWKAKKRSRILTKLRSETGRARNESFTGSIQDLLLTEIVKEGSTVGRTSNYKPVVLREELPLGTFVRARITGAEDAYLWGELL
jgi:MiaB-like tRNA modifying enzyme